MPTQYWSTITVQQLSEAKRKLQIPPLGSTLPVGGTAGQVLYKIDAVNYHVGWTTILGGLITAGRGIVFSGTSVNFAQAGAYTAGSIPFATGASAMGFDASNLFWDAANAFLGIGTNAPADRLRVTRAYSDALSHSLVTFDPTTDTSGGAKRTFSFGLSTTGAANFNAGLLSGGAISCTHQGSGNITGFQRVLGLELYHGKGASGTGNIDSSLGLFIQGLNQNAAGTITDLYDLFIETPITTGAIVNNYALWQNSATAWNYFAGNIVMGAFAFTDHVGLRFEKTFNTASHAVAIEAWVNGNPPADTAEFNAGGYFKGTTIGGFNFTNSNTAACGVLALGIHDGTGTCATATGVFSLAQQNNVGGVTAARAFEGRVDANNAGGTIGTGYGIRILTPLITGAITTYYGCYLQPGGGSTIYGFYQAAAAATEYNFFQGNTAFGTATFSATVAVRIQRTYASVAATYGTYCDITSNPGADTGAVQAGGFFQLQTSGAFNFTLGTNSIRGVVGSAYHNGTGTATQVVGGHLYAYKANTGAVTTMIGVRTQINNSNATNAITTGYSIFVDVPTTTGAITTYYGLYLSAGGGSTKYGIAQVGTADLNYFAGFSALGSSSPVNTTFALFGASTAAISSQRILRGSAAYAGTVEGDFWNDYTQHCLTGYIAGLKQFDSRVCFVQTDDAVVTNTNAETTLFGAGIGTLTMPANFFVVGKSLRMTLRGKHTMDATPPTITFRVKLGGVTFATAVYTDLNDTNQYFEINFILTCRTTGAGGTGIGQGYILMGETTGTVGANFWQMVMTATAAMNTTGALALDVTAQPNVADAGSSITITNAVVEIIA